VTRSLLLINVALSLALVSIDARADDEHIKHADQLFREGQRLLKQGKLEPACAAFAESQQLDPALGTLLNLADCHAQQRRFATARAEFEEAAQRAAQAGQRERESFAKEQLKQLDPLLSYVTIRFDGPASSVAIDGKEASASEPIPLDPGPHEFRFAAPARMPRTVRFEVANGPSAQTLDAPHLEPQAQAAPHPEAQATPKRDDTRRTAALAIAAGGGVALLVGAYFGLHAASKKSDADAHCNGHFCDADGLSLQDDAHSAATLSTIAFGLGIVAVGVGAYLYYSTPKGAHAALLTLAPTPGGARFEARW
jgi:tetratricopeptide (TPR) repeat protein